MSHVDLVRGVLPDYVDPLPRSRGDVVYFVKQRRFVVTVLVAVLGTWLLWPVPATPGAASDSEERVAEFLTAVRDRDVDAALAMTGGVPSGADPGFLVPSAISRDWGFEEVEDRNRDEDDPLEVEVEVSATLVDAGGYGHPVVFELERGSADEEWTLVEPFALVRFPVTALAYVEANGVRLPESVVVSGGDDSPPFAMFPGTYQFYSDVDSVVEVEPEFAVLVPDLYIPEVDVSPPGVRLVDEAVAQSAVNAYIDDCANLAELAVGGCPFGTDRVPVPGDNDHIFDAVSKVEWEVVEYPVVTVDGDGLKLTDRSHGEIRLTATSAGSTEEAVVDCQIVTDRLAIRVLPDGRLFVYPEGYAGRLSDMDVELLERRTCDV